MDDAVDPRDERLGRRLRIGIRLVLYPMALGLIVIAWGQYDSDPPRKVHTFHIVRWSGATSQGQAMRARTADGVLTVFDTHLIERCSDGSTFTFRWFPGQQRFVQRGEQLRGRVTAFRGAINGRPLFADNLVRARIGARPHGVIRARSRWTTASGTVRCDSGAVRFELSRSADQGRTP